MIDPVTLVFIAGTLKKAFEAGTSIYDFIKEIEQTGTVPQEAWDEMAVAFDDANQFWSEVPDEASDPAA